MQLMLVRHGNTFNPGEEPVRAGSRNDLPLVERGKEQAKEVAAFLKKNDLIPDAIFCSPLQRTRVFAEIIQQKLGLTTLTVQEEERLNELDYGEWTGLTNKEIEKRFGRESFEAWEEHSRWPEQGNWDSSEEEIIQEVKSLVQEFKKQYSQEKILLVSSNGRLRYFLSLIEDELEKRRQSQMLKMRTGHISYLNLETSKLEFWNANPHKNYISN